MLLIEASFYIQTIVFQTLSFSHCIVLHQNFEALGISMLLIEASFCIQTIVFQTLSFFHCIVLHQNFAALGISMLLIEASFYLFIYRPLSFRHCLFFIA